MKTVVIQNGSSADLRFNLKSGAGTDAVHTSPVYAYAVCRLETDKDIEGIGLAFTLGIGNQLVCQAIDYLLKYIEGKEINELMSDFGCTFKSMADDPNFRWLGPHKGVVHLALAAVVNACFDLWAKSRQVPLWKLLIDLSPEALTNTLDFSYLEDVLTKTESIDLLNKWKSQQESRQHLLTTGYPGYDTSIGWFQYTDDQVRANIKAAMNRGFTAMKLKVGSADAARDVRRANLVREVAGDQARIMLDVNQQWNLPKAISVCQQLISMKPYWIEEPTHPDDVQAHVTLANEVPVKIALGEHVPNRVVFKNFMQSGCVSFNQVDVVRVGGVAEFILISLLSRKYRIPVVPHVGDMGQIHQHLVLFNHISLDHPVIMLEHIPHLKNYFKYPAQVREGFYKVPQEPGMSADLKGY